MSEENKMNVLVAEDSAVNRKILVHLLVKMGFEVSEFEDGAKAWEDFKSQPAGHYSVVFSDIMMPEMDGLELLKKCSNRKRNKRHSFCIAHSRFR